MALLSATTISISSFAWSGTLTNLFAKDPPLYKRFDHPSRLSSKMTSLHIEPVSSGNTTVAIYVGDSKIYLDTTGFRPTRTYLLKVKASYRAVSAVPAPLLCEASVFNEALHLLTTHSTAQRLQEPALSAIFTGHPSRFLLVPGLPTRFRGSSTSNPTTGHISCQLSASEQQRFVQVGQNKFAYWVSVRF